jgi:hypothetical protein
MRQNGLAKFREREITDSNPRAQPFIVKENGSAITGRPNIRLQNLSTGGKGSSESIKRIFIRL